MTVGWRAAGGQSRHFAGLRRGRDKAPSDTVLSGAPARVPAPKASVGAVQVKATDLRGARPGGAAWSQPRVNADHGAAHDHLDPAGRGRCRSRSRSVKTSAAGSVRIRRAPRKAAPRRRHNNKRRQRNNSLRRRRRLPVHRHGKVRLRASRRPPHRHLRRRLHPPRRLLLHRRHLRPRRLRRSSPRPRRGRAEPPQAPARASVRAADTAATHAATAAAGVATATTYAATAAGCTAASTATGGSRACATSAAPTAGGKARATTATSAATCGATGCASAATRGAPGCATPSAAEARRLRHRRSAAGKPGEEAGRGAEINRNSARLVGRKRTIKNGRLSRARKVLFQCAPMMFSAPARS